MRIALLVVVVAVHLLVIWLLTLSRRVAPHEDELTPVPISMLPEPLRSQPPAPTQHTGSSHVTRARPPATAKAAPHVAATPLVGTAPPPSNTETPDWRTQAEIIAQSSAQQIVAAEDAAKRRANALTAPYKPMPGPRARGHEFAWDPTPKHRFTAIGHGAFVMPLNDQCAIVIIIVPWFGCSLGPKPAANGDLFKYMRGPVKYGDWDWRVQDP